MAEETTKEEVANPTQQTTGPGPKDTTTTAPATPKIFQFIQEINKGVKPLKPLPTVSDQFQKTQETYTPTETDNSVDLTKFRDYINNPNPSDPNLNIKRAENQSTGEQLLHGLGQFGSQFVGGASMALGTSLDIEQSINTLRGVEDQYSNMLTDFGRNLIQKGQENMPIYEKDLGGVHPSDPAWWSNMFAQTGLSAGIAAESVAEAAAMTYLTEGTGLGVEVGAIGNKVKNLTGLGELFKTITNADKLKTTATFFGVINRHHESIMEASDSFKEEYGKLIARNYSDADARKFAAKAASATYIGNLPLMALDVLSFRAMTFNPVSGASEGGLIDSFLEHTLGRIKSPLLQKAAAIGLESTSEGGEEFWQYLASEEGKHYADTLTGQDTSSILGQRFNQYIKGPEIWNNTLSGAIGGVLLGGMFKGYEKLTNGRARKALDSEYKSFVDNMSTTTLDLNNKIREAEESGNEDAANNLRRQLGVNKALQAIHLDNIKDEDNAYKGYTNYLQSTLDAANDNEQLKALGLDGHGDFLKANVPGYLEDAQNIKDIYDQLKQTAKRDAIIPTTYRQYLVNNLSTELNNINGRIALTQASIPDLSNLSQIANDKAESQFQMGMSDALQTDAEQRLARSKDEVEKAGLQGRIDHAKFVRSFHQDRLEQLKDVEGNFSDEDIQKNVQGNLTLEKLKQNKAELENNLAGLRKELNTWNDPKFQAKQEEDRLYNVINKATTTKEIDAIADQANQSNPNQSDRITNALKSKRKELEAKEELDALNNKPNPTVTTTQTPLMAFVQTQAQQQAQAPVQQQVQPQSTPFGNVLTVDDNDLPASVVSEERKNMAATIVSGGTIFDFDEPTPVESIPTGKKVENNTPKPLDYNDLGVGMRIVSGNKNGVVSQKANGQVAITFDSGGIFTTTPSFTEIFPELETPTLQKATIVNTDSLFEPEKLSDNISENKQEAIKNKLSDYIESLKRDLGQEPTFQDLVDDFIKHTSKDATDRNFNLLKLGWTLNSRKANFDEVYNNTFTNRKALGLDFFETGSDVLATEDQVRDTNEVLSNNVEQEEAEPIQTDLTAEGQKVFIHIDPYKTVTSTLKMAHLSMPYIKTITQNEYGQNEVAYTNPSDELNQSEYVDSKELMNPNLWGVGTKADVKIPEEADNILISQWNKDWGKEKSVKFSEWAANKDKTSDEYIGRVPMIIYNKDGKGVAMIHDIEWYNPTNVGLGEKPQVQAKIIADAREELLQFRKDLLNKGQLEIEVTEKKPGTKFTIDKDKPLITIEQANPRAQVGFVNDNGNLVTKDGIINFNSLINSQDLTKGHQYDIRQVGLTEDGKPQYFAAKMFYDKIDSDAKMSVLQALRTYVSQFDDQEVLSNKAEIAKIKRDVQDQTGLDLFNKADLEKYLNLFIPTSKDSATDERSVATNIESKDSILNDTPYISIQKGAVVFGIKGRLIDGKNQVNYFYPGMLKGQDPKRGASMINSMLSRMYQDDFLGQMKQNMDGRGIQDNTKVSHILYNNGQTTVSPINDYDAYLKSKLKTNIKSFDLGDGTYATFIQPVINYTYNKEQKEVSTIREGVTNILNNNPQLSKIGTSKEYSTYLEGVFPNTKINEIMYHNTKYQFDIANYDKTRGMYFTSSDKAHFTHEYTVIALLNTIHPKSVEIYEIQDKSWTKAMIDNYKKDGYDGLIADPSEYKKRLEEEGENPENFKQTLKFPEVVIFDPEQIHILGSKEDIKGFKDWKEKSNPTPVGSKSVIDVVNETTKEITGLEPEVSTEQDHLNEILNSLDDFKALGLSDDVIQALMSLKKDSNGEPSFDPDYEALTDDIVKSIKTKLTKIQDLDTIDRNNIVQFIANQVMNKIDPQKRNSIDRKDLLNDINKSFDDIIQPKVDFVNSKINALQSLYDTGKYPNLKEVIDQFGNLKANADILKKNWNFLINEAFEDYISKFTGITVVMNRQQNNIDISINDEQEINETNEDQDNQQELNIESNDQREKDYSKESIEDNGKNSVSYLLKRFLAQIPSYDKNGGEKKGFMGVTTYPGFDYYYDAIGKMLTSSGDTISDWNDMKIRLQQFSEAQPWVDQIIKRLDQADDQIKNAFMYNFTRDGLSMKFVMYSYDRKRDSYNLKVYDTNANEILRVIQTQWRNNFNQSILANKENEINTENAQKLLDQFNKWVNSKTLPNEIEANKWLNNFGIELSPEAMKELYTKGYYVTEGKDTIQYPYKNMFTKSATTSGIFGLLARKLELMVSEKANKNFLENDVLNPFENTNGVLNKLAKIESKYSANITTNSFRDGTKSIYGYTPGKFATSFVNKLKNDSKVLSDKLQISFDKQSFILNLLNNDADFKGKFNLDHIGINAFKELGKKLYQDNELNSLADSDHELVKLGMFQDIQQGEVKSKANGLNLRIGRMFLPTMSDKKTMLDITTAVLNIQSKDIDLATNKLTDQVKEFLFSQLIEPELRRIISHHSSAYRNGVSPNFLINQKGYNLGAQIFHFIPAMNNLQYTKEDNTSLPLIEFIANTNGLMNEDAITKIKDKIKNDSYDLLDQLVNKLVTDKIVSWENSKFVTRNADGLVTSINYLNNTYLNSKTGSLDEKLKVSAYDYVINSIVNNANMHMLIAGDIANFSQDKAFKNGFMKDEQGMPIPYKATDPSIYAKIEADIIGVNLGKRLAMLIAPGSTIAQSQGDRYLQLFAKDRISATENLDFLISLYHGRELADKYANEINILKTFTDPQEISDATKILAKRFPDLAAYMEIESTDAQEYTTSKEHLDILFRQGRISVEDYSKFKTKLDAQRQEEKKGLPISEENFLSTDDLKLIFQPIKPVYTGQINDVNNDMSRMVYIKSSSFPLIPQMTQAFPGLNELRKGMEALQEKEGKNVRLSYDTANKVGAVAGSNQIKLWDEQGNYIPNAIDADSISNNLANGIPTSAITLDRDFFRIQQDVPFKSTKIDHQDSVTLGTQMMKLMFGDGISKIQEKIFDLNGNKVSGQELHDHYNNMFNQWIGGEKSNLYEKLGINEQTGKAIDEAKTAQKLQNLLKDEAKKRGYPKQDIEALELDISNGNAQFTLPLWLSPNSNRYEALLNAIVTNRLLNLKLPGASFVVGSEEGFRTSTDIESVDQSKVIFTDKWEGSLQPAQYDKQGNLKKAQVLIPSKFRNKEGKLLDLSTLAEKRSGRLYLKIDMIDSELLTLPSFRIPTSGHVSMAQIEIVGFLPTESGDLMIVPKNFTKQKGLDFDVDKENTYWLHHTIADNGKLIALENGEVNLSNYQSDMDDINGAVEDLKVKLANNSELTRAIQQYEDEIALSDEMGFNPSDAKRFIKQLKSELIHDAKKSDLKQFLTLQKQFKDLKSKLIQNEIIKSYTAVLGNGDERIQQKINKVLSTDFAEDQANLIDSLINTNVDRTLFTTLSDEYQKYKMSLGAAGKLGIGVYSNYVVLHGLIQQSNMPINLTTEGVDENGFSIIVPYNLTIGKYSTNGSLGRIDTLDGSRSIADVNAERQNTATDNEKLQIMGKTNVNEITINIDSVLSLMGFDKDSAIVNGKSQEVSIPYLLLSQPIIREYVDQIRATRSNIAGYNPNAELDVITNLYKKYGENAQMDFLDEESIRDKRKELTGQKLVDNIIDGGKDDLSQQTILHLFLELKQYGESIGGIISKLNIQRSGLGKSMFEMMEKYMNVSKLQFNSKVSNVSSLIGNYIDSELLAGFDLQDLKDDGYTIFNDNPNLAPFAVKPNTVTGALMVHSAKAGYELWKDYFPHQNGQINNVINSIINTTSNEDISETKRLQLQYEIFEEMKKYLYSSNQLGIFKGDPQSERVRLFFDRNDNTSIATYLKNYMKSDTASSIMTNNKLLSRLQYQLEKGNLPSILKFDNSKSEDFNEEYKYQALVELMDKNIPLDDYNGKPYTSRMLAKDLISYTYLEGGIQEAIQFAKYVPVAYLKEMGFADRTQMWQRAANGALFVNSNGETVDLWRLMLGNTEKDLNSNIYPRFLQQYFQHNPGRLTKLDSDNLSPVGRVYNGKATLENLIKFIPKNLEEQEPKSYVAIYNTDIKQKNKYQIYKFDGTNYQRIPTLGTFGMSEYSLRENDVNPLIDTYRDIVPAAMNTTLESATVLASPFNINEGNLSNSLQAIIDAKIDGVSDLVETLMPYMPNNIKLEVGDTANIKARALYTNGTITMNSKYLGNPNVTNEDKARTLVHEYIHALTNNRIDSYFDRNGKLKVAESQVPSDLLRLHNIYREMVSVLGSELTDYQKYYKQAVATGQPLLRTEGDRFLYANMNMNEFTAMIMTDPDIQQRMSEIEYKRSGQTLLEKFTEAIKKILNAIGVKFDENSVTSQAINSIFEVLETQKNESKDFNKFADTPFGRMSNMTENDQAVQNLIDESDKLNNTDEEDDTNIDFTADPDFNEETSDCIF